MNKYKSEDVMINPSHYKSSNGIECIDAIKAATEGLNGFEGYLVGNAVKYLWRFKKKGKPIQDVEKTIWYVTDLLNELKEHEKEVEEITDYIVKQSETFPNTTTYEIDDEYEIDGEYNYIDDIVTPPYINTFLLKERVKELEEVIERFEKQYKQYKQLKEHACD